jgi:tetratricopeptide (TPR) repeat protein
LEKVSARLDDPKVRGELSRLGIGFLATVLSLQVASDQGIRRAGGRGRVNEDGFPVLEYEAPKAFFLAQPAGLLAAYDERLQAPSESALYLKQHLQTQRLDATELAEMTVYHLTHGSLGERGLGKLLLEAWLADASADPRARWIRFQMEQGEGGFPAALEDLRYLLERDPTTRPEYLEAAADIQFRLYMNRQSVFSEANPNQALAHLEQLLRLMKTNRAVIYEKLAKVHARSGDWRTALRYLEEGAADASKNRDTAGAESLWLAAAQLAEEKNHPKRAVESVRSALAVNPKNHWAQQKLQQLLYGAR